MSKMMGSPRSSPKPKDRPADGIVKHRACDECRSRKLACSKEPEGCARCRREGVQCVYSPQKPMGRPRKRRAVDTVDGAAAMPSLGMPDMGLDASFAFLDGVDDPSLEFLDLLTPSSTLLFPSGIEQYPPPPATQGGDPYAGHFSFGADLLGHINFAETDSGDEQVTSDIRDSLSRYMASQVTHELAPMPSLSPESFSTGGSTISTSSSSPSPRAYPNSTCGCLSALYLAMDNLTFLPQSAMAAMRTARHACKVAYDVLNCTGCSLPLIENPAAVPPMQSFQNLMLLGALIPAIANGYSRILELVDAEVAAARQEGQQIHFAFREAGGLWGKLAEEEASCGTIQSYNDRDLEPDHWRLSVRALLKCDIYGFTFQKGPGDEGRRSTYQHLGLKDVIDALDRRSRLRHEKVDAMIANGEIPPENLHHFTPGPPGAPPPKQKNCSQIIDLARGALEKLVIA